MKKFNPFLLLLSLSVFLSSCANQLTREEGAVSFLPIDISANNPGFEEWNNGTFFENPSSDGTYLADTWRTAWGGGNLPCFISRESEFKTEGHFCLRQTMAENDVTATSFGTFFEYAGYEALKGRTIRLTADVWCSVPNKAEIKLTPYSSRHKLARSSRVTTPNTWTKLHVDMLMPEDADNLQVHFGTEKKVGNNEVYMIDNVKLYEILIAVE